MGTKNNPGEYDCYENAEPDEPMFVLLARDRHAVALVWFWYILRMMDGEDAKVVAEAAQCGESMLKWRKEKEKPDAMHYTEVMLKLTAYFLEIAQKQLECDYVFKNQ